MAVLHVVSGLVVCLVLMGLYCRRQPRVHLKFMLAAFVIDLLLVVYIEATRGAVETVVSQFRPLLWLHAGISLGVLACYAAMIVLGRRMLAGHAESRARHRTLGMTFCVLRALNYVTAWVV